MRINKFKARFGRHTKLFTFWNNVVFFLLAAILVYWIVGGMQIYATNTDDEIDGTVTIGSTDNQIVISVTNPSTDLSIESVKLEIAKEGQWITNVRIQADTTGPIAPNSTRSFNVLFDISMDAEKDAIDKATLRLSAQGALVDHPNPVIVVKIRKSEEEKEEEKKSELVLKLVTLGENGEAGAFRDTDPNGASSERNIQSLQLTEFPLEIVLGKPFTITAEVKQRSSWGDRHLCYDPEKPSSKDPRYKGPLMKIRMKNRGSKWLEERLTLDEAFRYDLSIQGKQIFRPFCGDAPCYPDTYSSVDKQVYLEKDGEVRFTLNFHPVDRSPDDSKNNLYYRLEVDVDGDTTFWDRKIAEKFVFFSLERWDYSKSPLQPCGVYFQFHSVAHLTLYYAFAKKDSPVVTSYPPYSHPEEFSRPPKIGSITGEDKEDEGEEDPPGTDKDTDVITGTGKPDPDEGEEVSVPPDKDGGEGVIPIDPKALNPNSTDVSPLIREWILVAEPPQNATEGANFRYDPWGRVIGTAGDGGIITQNQKPTYALATPEQTVWSLRKKLDSVNHCTVEEYVLAKLQNRSLENCRGRYKATEAVTVGKLTGLTLSDAKKKLEKDGLKSLLSAGSPAPTKRDEGTIASQEPGPGTKLRPGKSVKLEVYGPFNPKVSVPDVVGLEIEKAKTKLKEEGLKTRLVAFGPAPSNDLIHKVKEVDPEAGSKVTPGTEIKVKVYGEYSPPLLSVPRVIGLPLANAKSSLSQAGFQVMLNAGGKPSSREQEGTVERQRPDAGTKTKPGSEVTIFIYGPYVETITVPNLVGTKLTDAKRKLENIGLKLQPTLLGSAPEPAKAQQVVEQQPLATTQVEAGSSVQVKIWGNYVAPGVTVPNLRGMTIQQAKNTLANTNLKIQSSLIGAAPNASWSQKVRSQQPVAGSTVPPGSTIQVQVWGNYVATGTRIPDVRGMTLSDAKNTLGNLGLRLQHSSLGSAPTREKAFRINSQNPLPGTMASPGSEVKAYVFSNYMAANERSGKPFFVIFDINLLWPANLPETKKAPRGADSATKERIKAENQRRLKAALQNFRIENSIVMPISKLAGKAVPFPIHIFGGAVSKYPRSIFKEGDKFSLPFAGNYIDKKDGSRKQMEGALLLKAMKAFDNINQVFAVYPDLKKEFQKSDNFFSKVKIGSRSGSFDISDEKGSFRLGPLESGWSDRNKRKAFILTKTFIENFSLDFNCFIATAVYKNPVAPELFTLRRFRNIVLLSSEEGRRLVNIYYKYGPALAEKVRGHSTISGSIRFVLDLFVGWLNSTDLSDSFSRKILDSVVVITDKVLSMLIK